MKKSIANITEKEYRDELKKLIFQVKIEVHLLEDIHGEYKDNKFVKFIDELQNFQKEDIILAISLNLFLNKYPYLTKEDISNIIGKRLTKYDFIKEILSYVDDNTLSSLLDIENLKDILNQIVNNRLKIN